MIELSAALAARPAGDDCCLDCTKIQAVSANLMLLSRPLAAIDWPETRFISTIALTWLILIDLARWAQIRWDLSDLNGFV